MSFNSIDDLKNQLQQSPERVEFADVIAFVDSTFIFTPTAFTNGAAKNQVNQNNGSCKLLALGQFMALSVAETLALFGRFYRQDVLQHPDGDDHANIRNFMQTGYHGVVFDAFPLQMKD